MQRERNAKSDKMWKLCTKKHRKLWLKTSNEYEYEIFLLLPHKFYEVDFAKNRCTLKVEIMQYDINSTKSDKERKPHSNSLNVECTENCICPFPCKMSTIYKAHYEIGSTISLNPRGKYLYG